MASKLTRISAEEFDGLPAWRLTAADGASALIAQRGATLISWQPAPGAPSVIDGYQSAEELLNRTGNRSLVEGPWVGPIGAGTYRFAGKDRKVKGDGEGALIGDLDFKRVRAGDALMLSTRFKGIAAYPWKLEISVVFALEQGADSGRHLSVTIQAENISGASVPLALGWRPYVRFPGMEGISNLSLSVQARTRIATNQQGIPIAGDAALTGVASPILREYIGKESLDAVFGDLVPNSGGVVVTQLRDPVRGSLLQLTQEPAESPYVRVSTADDLSRGSRGSLLLSPRTALVNSFNRPDQASLVQLAEGDVRSLTATLSYWQ